MSSNFSLDDRLRENRLFIGRVVAAVIFMAVATLALVARLVYLQVTGHDLYTSLSRENQVKISPLTPSRGLIFDRNGEVLADNFATYSLEVLPEQVKDLNEKIARLREVITISDDDMARFEAQRSQRRSFESIPLRLELTEEELARFAVNMPYFPGFEIRKNLQRTYPYGYLTAHLVGYVGRISEAELQVLDPAQYRGTLHVGKTGIEKSYESILHGKTGYEEYETNVSGRAIRELGIREPLSGADLYLSIDIRMQKLALDALGRYSGAVVAIEPKTGKVLVMASNPSFDPTPFIHGIKRQDYDKLNQDPELPLYDRTIRGIYPPGSTVKPFVALAGLEVLNLSPGRRISCPGYFRLPHDSHRYRDWRHGGHGSVDLRYAIVQSCDVYFYDLANRIGIDRLQKYMARFSFGKRTGVDLEGEKSGLFPSEEWKKNKRKQPWFAGETIIAGIGQGYVQATPLQMAHATAMLAIQGRPVDPRVVSQMKAAYPVESPYPKSHDQESKLIPAKSWQTVVDAMTGVVHSSQGTAKRISAGLHYRIAGKTGTAQVFTVGQGKSYHSFKLTKKMKDHAWFVAFAPVESPRIAVAVIAEHGGHGGTVAAPIARKIMDFYLNSENGDNPLPESNEKH